MSGDGKYAVDPDAYERAVNSALGIDRPVACPFCGTALVEGRFHSCREMRDDEIAPVPVGSRFTPRLADIAVAIVAIFVLAYLGAYWLRSVGVNC